MCDSPTRARAVNPAGAGARSSAFTTIVKGHVQYHSDGSCNRRPSSRIWSRIYEAVGYVPIPGYVAYEAVCRLRAQPAECPASVPTRGPHAMRIKTERPAGNPGILLAQGTLRRITRIVSMPLPAWAWLVPGLQGIEFHEHFTPSLHHLGTCTAVADSCPGIDDIVRTFMVTIFADNTVATQVSPCF